MLGVAEYTMMYTHTVTHTHASMHTHTHMHAHTHAHTHARTHAHTHTHTCTHARTHTHTHTHTHMHTHTHTHTHTYLTLQCAYNGDGPRFTHKAGSGTVGTYLEVLRVQSGPVMVPKGVRPVPSCKLCCKSKSELNTVTNGTEEKATSYVSVYILHRIGG